MGVPDSTARQQKAERAIAAGIFKEEIVPIELPQKKGDPLLVDNDEHPRAGTTTGALGKLRTAFLKDGGTVTAGNASGLNDGASAIVVMSQRMAQERGLEPLGVVESYASVGVEPRVMGIGPIDAAQPAERVDA